LSTSVIRSAARLLARLGAVTDAITFDIGRVLRFLLDGWRLRSSGDARSPAG
jgi:hypothetical protein